MPAASTISRPKTKAQQVALWMRRAVSLKRQPEFLQALTNGDIDPAMRNKNGETLLHVLAGTEAPAVYDAVLECLKHALELWPG